MRKNIEKWAKSNLIPPNVLATYIRLEKEERERKEKQEFEALQTTLVKDEKNSLKRICKEYKIKLEAIAPKNQSVK